jgi:hypothetical protein
MRTDTNVAQLNGLLQIVLQRHVVRTASEGKLSNEQGVQALFWERPLRLCGNGLGFGCDRLIRGGFLGRTPDE